MRTITIVNQKGGCGKTTTAINLASVLAQQGRRVLLADMDPQSHCAAGLGIPEQKVDLDIGDAMLGVGRRPLDAARLLWPAGHNLFLLPSRMRLAGLEAPRGGLADLHDKERRLTSVLREFAPLADVAIVDCGPSIGLLTFNALAAADFVLIPVETGFFSLQGATRQVNTVKTMARRLGITLPVWVLPTIHDDQSAVSNDLLGELHRRFKDRVTPLVIRRDPKLREATSYGQTIHDFAPCSTGADDYRRLATWAMERLSLPHANDPAVTDWLDEPEPTDQAYADPSVPTTAELEPAAPEPVVTLNASATAVAAFSAVRPELKPISRAEDVARRAQEFLRRVSQSRPAAQTMPTDVAASTLRSAPAAQPAPSGAPIGAPMVAPRPPVAPIPSRLYGVRVTPQGALFVQPLNQTGSAAVAGSFNGWSATTHTMRKNTTLGVFELLIKLPPGKYHYRVVQDDTWSADPYNDQCETNPFNEPNSVFVVPG